MAEAVDELTWRQMKDDLEEVLTDMTGAVAGDPARLRDLEMRAPAHGTSRCGQGFDVADLGRESALLRQTVVAEVEAGLGRQLAAAEARVLHALLDLVITQTFVAHARMTTDGLRLRADAAGRFLGGLAHDLRNDLNGALLTMQLAEARAGRQRRPGAAGGGRGELTEGRRGVGRTVASMTRLLESETIRAGPPTTRAADVSLRSLLSSVSRSAARNAGRQAGAGPDLDIRIECPDPAPARTDPELVSTILINLAGNAAKYAGDAPITLRAVPHGGGGDGNGDGAVEGWRVEVIDEGPGIPPERLGRLFDEFDRAGRDGGGGAAGGMGLGLSIAKRAADLIGARLSVDSRPGHGTTFTLDLPPGRPAHKLTRPGGPAGSARSSAAAAVRRRRRTRCCRRASRSGP